MSKKKPITPKKITNKRAKFDYNLTDSLMAGIVLSGAETKSLRLGNGHLRGAYVVVKGDELYLLNATITGFNGAQIEESEQTRSRKLLLKRREIDRLLEAKKQGMSIIPTELLTQGRYIKVRLGVGSGKKNYDKRQAIKKRDQEKSNQIELKRY